MKLGKHMRLITTTLLLLVCGCSTLQSERTPGAQRLQVAISVLRAQGENPLEGEYDLDVRRSEEHKMWMYCFWPKPGYPGGDLNVWIHDDGQVEYVRLP